MKEILQNKKLAFLSFFYFYVICSLVFTVTVPRDYKFYKESLIHLNVQNYPMQAMGGFALLVSLYIISSALLKKYNPLQGNRDRTLLFLAIALFIFSAILSTFFGYRPYYKPYIFVEFLLFLSPFFVEDLDLQTFVKTIKGIMLFFVLGTVFMVFLFPDWSVQFQYNQGMLNFLEYRLYGLTSNSNYTAPLSALYLIFELEFPMKKRKWRIACIVLSILVIFFTQSKTLWILLAIYLFIKMMVKYGRKIKEKMTKRTVIVAALFLVLFLAAGGFVLKNSSIVASVTQNQTITTLTGRTIIWDLTLDAWSKNKVFGYGMGLWDKQMYDEYSAIINKKEWVFSHAHNQYFQSLGETGIIGLAFLLVYFSVLLYIGKKYARQTKGLSLFFALFMIIRGFSEPDCRHFFADFNIYIHFILFTYFVIITQRNKV